MRRQREVYITLPEGDELDGHCGRLLRSLYGTQDANHIWQLDYTATLNAGGYETGSPRGGGGGTRESGRG